MNTLDNIRFKDTMIPFPKYDMGVQNKPFTPSSKPILFGELAIGDEFVYNGELLTKLDKYNAESSQKRHICHYQFKHGDKVRRNSLNPTNLPELNDAFLLQVNFEKSKVNGQFNAILLINHKEVRQVRVITATVPWIISFPKYTIHDCPITKSHVMYKPDEKKIAFYINNQELCSFRAEDNWYDMIASITIDLSNAQIEQCDINSK